MARGTLAIDTGFSELLPNRGTLVLAVSGGADSIALLLSLVRYWRNVSPRHRTIVAAHINHNLRRTALRDQKFVTQLCEKLGVRCHTKKLSEAPKANLEAWARAERYKFLEHIRARVKASWILTAHTANDVAETFLIKLFQNRDSSLIAERDKRRRLLRPILHIDRAQVEEFLREQKQTWCEDETNLDLSFARNWVRHELLPLLRERWGRSLDRTLSERAEALQGDRLLADQFVIHALASIPAAQRKKIAILGKTLRALPTQARALFGCEVLQSCFKLRVGRLHGARIVDVICGESKVTQLPGNRHLTIRGGKLCLLAS